MATFKKIQKFALRFSTLHEEILKGEDESEPLDRDFRSEFSTQSEWEVAGAVEDLGAEFEL
ncbi:hypothetical protein CCACVL1_29913 [Corchorus capsularis]|uniref:Uncharacterized protein n=1 Tax=Corchorus capsularis TaxID=210143 RepID=A0A1R3FZH2_COCAP|nr:hypothetical protein CCACVL1_29913 [Corchorus capsularis]